MLTDQADVIGVIGGGQLCRMMAEAATPIGLEIVFLDPTPNAPARPVSRKQIVGGFDEAEPMKRLINYSDFLTYDIELADAELIRSIDPDIPVNPKPSTLLTIQDKLDQKETLQEAGIPVPEFRDVSSEEDLRIAGDELGYPLMVKARYGGYDGRGNYHLSDESDIPEVFEQLQGPMMVEEFIEFDRELSVIAARNSTTIRTYPPTMTVHEDEILRHTISPAPIDESVADRATDVARDILECLDGRGVYGIELFQDGNEILLNEVAPRPHNSGHWTIEGAVTSQFEQHLRAVADRPLGSTELVDNSVSMNILGDEQRDPVNLAGVNTILETDHAHLHWYGKAVERPLRKMGHFTLTDDRPTNTLLEEALTLRDSVRFKDGS
jgi:5-(carboxyamino)imidazole ribonucleotide synthase